MFILKQTFIITIQLEKILKKLSEDSSRETRFLIEKEILQRTSYIKNIFCYTKINTENFCRQRHI